jgi:predicted outer membrane repeat protein
MPHSVAPAWTRIATSVLLIATALVGGSVAASPAQAAPPMSVNCSTLVGSVSTDDSFNAAVTEVNAGNCNEIIIASSFRLLTPKTIDANKVTSLTLAGNRDDSTLTSAPGIGIYISTLDDTSVNLTVSNLTFSGFDDSTNTSSALGADSNADLTAVFTNVSFINNFGGYGAGGINLHAGGSAYITINGYSQFRGNRSSSSDGGAILVDGGPSSTLTIGAAGDDSISFVTNTSLNHNGGAIAFRGTGTDSQLTTNGVTFADDSAGGAGGAIYTLGSAVLNNTDFTGNSASREGGGAVYADRVVITGGTFEGNRAAYIGGAVSAGGDVATSQIANATFTNNSAVGSGGAIHTSGLLTVTGSTFRDDSSGGAGGAIAADDTISIAGSVFQDDTAAGSGGAVISLYASVITQNSTYSTNRARDYGGAISAPNRVTSTDDTFIGNRTTLLDGGALSGGHVVTRNINFTDNRAARDGGAVVAGSIDDSSSRFIGNQSGDDGGATYLGNASRQSMITGSTFRDDSAVQGGAIYAFGPLTVTNSLFEDDTAANTGGAIVADDTLAVSFSTFRRNVALQSAGAIAVDDTNTIVNSLFESNEARGPLYGSNGYGGAVLSDGPTTITDTTFTGNKAAQEGGALSANRLVTLTDDTFTGNVSTNGEGGAVNVAAPGSIVATNSLFTSNTSGRDGGAIRVDGAATLTSSTFELNRTTTAGKNGGAVSATGNVSITSSTFTSNRSTQAGGAIYLRADFPRTAAATVTDSGFHANTTTSAGGALSVDDTAIISRSTFTDDTSGSIGGAISVKDLIMDSSSFKGNRTLYNGGAIYVSRSGDISNSTFVNNFGGYGGALSFGHPTAASRVVYSTLVDNTAVANQGAAINAFKATPIALTGSVLSGVSPLCYEDTTGPTYLNLTSSSAYSFATDTSCSGDEARTASTSINTMYTTDDSLGVASTMTTDDTPGWQVVIPDDTAVVNAYVPLSVLPSITTDQLNGLRNSPNGLASAGSVQVRPTSMTGPASVTVAPGSNATFTVTGYPGIGPTITYQWQRSTDGTSWSNIPGAQTATLTLSSVTTSDSGLQVRVLAADAYGNDGTSATATLTVSSPGPGPGPNPTPTPTPTPAPSPSPVPIPSPIPPGGALLQVDGRVVPVDVQQRPGDAGLRVQGQGWDMTLDGLDRDGNPLGLNPQGALVIDTDSGVRMGGSGFAPGSQIGFFLDPPVAKSTGTAYPSTSRATSATTDLGTLTISADGRYGAVIELPDTIAPGSHVLQAVGVGTSGERRVLSLGVVVDAWIDLKRGKRTPSGRFDVVRATGTTGGLPAGAVLTPWVRSPGQDTFRRGSASITVRADGRFEWTRKVQKSKGLAAYVSYAGTDSDRVYWARLR